MLMLMLNCNALLLSHHYLYLTSLLHPPRVAMCFLRALCALNISLSQRLLSFDSFSFLDLCRGRILK